MADSKHDKMIGEQLDKLLAQIHNNQITNLDLNQQFWTEVEGENKEPKCEKTLKNGSFITHLIQLKDGKIASGGVDKTVRLWNINSGQCEKTLVNSGSITCLIQLKDGRIASGGDDKFIKLWNINSGQCEKTIKGHCGRVSRLIQLSDEKIASRSRRKNIRIWDINSGEGYKVLQEHSDAIYTLIELCNGKIASGSADKTIKIWNVESGQCEKTLVGHESGVRYIIQLKDGRIASGSIDTTIRIWNIKSGQCEKTLAGYIGFGRSLIQLSDGRIASVNYDHTIKLWNINSGQCEKTLWGHSDRVRRLIQLPDGKLATGSHDTTIKIWDVASGQCEQTLAGHSHNIHILTQLSDGRIASASDDKTIKIWDLGGKVLVKKMEKINNSQVLGVLKELKNNISINSISLSGYQLNDQVCNFLVELLKSNKGIQLIDLNNAECTGDLDSFLQSPNIMLMGVGMQAKIGDFGLAKIKQEINSKTTGKPLGTYQWMAPELFNNNSCNKASDMYSYGMILWEIVTRATPWANVGNNVPALVKCVYNDKKTENIPQATPKALSELITSCWKWSANDRSKIEDAVKVLEDGKSKSEICNCNMKN